MSAAAQVFHVGVDTEGVNKLESLYLFDAVALYCQGPRSEQGARYLAAFLLAAWPHGDVLRTHQYIPTFKWTVLHPRSCRT